MAKYISKPQIVEAFQFEGVNTPTPPEWFYKAMEIGAIQVTLNENKGQYISVYGEKDHKEKAYVGDWVCRAEHGKIFVMHDKDFKSFWKPHRVKNERCKDTVDL